MTKFNFKTGDKVRYSPGERLFIDSWVGRTGVVVRIWDGHSVDVEFDDNDQIACVTSGNLELIGEKSPTEEPTVPWEVIAYVGYLDLWAAADESKMEDLMSGVVGMLKSAPKSVRDAGAALWVERCLEDA